MSGNAHQRRKRRRALVRLVNHMSATSTTALLAHISLGYLAHEFEIMAEKAREFRGRFGDTTHHP